MNCKIDKRGKIIVPKEIRDKLSITSETELQISFDNGAITIKPECVCSVCGKALPRALYKRGSCESCPIPVTVQIY